MNKMYIFEKKTMKTKCHYEVRSKLCIINTADDNISFRENIESFSDLKPIRARDNAFKFFQSLLEVTLESKGKRYVNHEQAHKDLSSFFVKPIDKNASTQNEQINSEDIIPNGISIYFVYTKEKRTDLSKELNEIYNRNLNEELLIHGVGNIGIFENPYFWDELFLEYEFYDVNGLEYEEKLIEIEILNEIDFENGIEKIETVPILETPFDFSILKKPYWWGKEENTTDTEVNYNDASTILDLINKGENNQVEFKTNLLYYHGKEGEYSGYKFVVRYIVAKTICSFLNSNGGFLIIGVSDKHELQGLEDDFSLAPKGKNKKDYFRLEIDKIIKEYFKEFASNITGDFVKINDKELFIFNIFPSKSAPVFLNNNGVKEFFVRYMASSQQYKDIEQIAKYCLEKWGNKE